jgi:hypothetical protein
MGSFGRMLDYGFSFHISFPVCVSFFFDYGVKKLNWAKKFTYAEFLLK